MTYRTRPISCSGLEDNMSSLAISTSDNASQLATLVHYINGRKVPGDSTRHGSVFNPATGNIESLVPLASRAEVDQAVAAAKAAWPSWADTPPLKRARIMFRFKQLLDQ